MRGGAQGDQIFIRIVAGLTAKLFVMNLQIFSTATVLAAPRVWLQHFAAQLVVSLSIELDSRTLAGHLVMRFLPGGRSEIGASARPRIRKIG